MAKRKGAGGNFERQLARQISLWIDPERDDHFVRSRGSGSFATNRHKKGQNTDVQCGDISGATQLGVKFCKRFIIEAKSGYNNETLYHLIARNKKSKLAAWIRKVKKESRKSGIPYWMIIHHVPRYEPIVYTNWNRIEVDCSLYGSFSKRTKTRNVNTVWFCRLDHLLKTESYIWKM